MQEAGLEGAVRGKKFKTTVPDASMSRAADLVKREFVASRRGVGVAGASLHNGYQQSFRETQLIFPAGPVAHAERAFAALAAHRERFGQELIERGALGDALVLGAEDFAQVDVEPTGGSEGVGEVPRRKVGAAEARGQVRASTLPKAGMGWEQPGRQGPSAP